MGMCPFILEDSFSSSGFVHSSENGIDPAVEDLSGFANLSLSFIRQDKFFQVFSKQNTLFFNM